MNETALRCEGICVSFGALRAVDDLSFDFKKGRLYSLIGPNGAGKTTFMNALSGRVTLTSGRVWLGNRDINRLRPYERTRAGLGRSFQISQLFPGFTVFENLRLGALAHQGKALHFWKSAAADPGARAQAEAVLEQVGLAPLRDVPAESLSHGDQRALEVGLALVTNPSMLLLDEPLAGVGHQDLEHAIELVGRVVKGRAVLLIEHNMEVVMNISDEILVMVQGKVLASGKPDQIKKDPRVRTAYLGEDV